MNKEVINQLIALLLEERMKVKLQISYLEIAGELDDQTLNRYLTKIEEIDREIEKLERKK